MYFNDLLITLITFIVGILFCSMIDKSLLDLTDLYKCPFCYGKDYCSVISDLHIRSRTWKDLFNNYLSSKNVFKTNKNVVVKKLGQDDELINFDQALCRKYCSDQCRIGKQDNCDFNRIEYDFRPEVLRHLLYPLPAKHYSFKICSENAIKYFLDEILHLKPLQVTTEEYYKNVWSMVQINVEPLILQVFRAADNWPVPQYYGSCGRSIFVENCNNMLMDFQNADWFTRGRITLNLLEAAYNLTFRHKTYGIYLTDLTTDNIMIRDDLTVCFSDLEDLVLTDKSQINDYSTVSLSHYNNNEEFIYSDNDLCAKSLNDHNFYSICWILWRNSFLHHPKGLHNNNILRFLENCQSRKQNMNLFTEVHDVMKDLRVILNRNEL